MQLAVAVACALIFHCWGLQLSLLWRQPTGSPPRSRHRALPSAPQQEKQLIEWHRNWASNLRLTCVDPETKKSWNTGEAGLVGIGP